MSALHRVVATALAACLLLALAARGDREARADDAAPADEGPKTTLVELIQPTWLGCELERARIRPYGWIEVTESFTAEPHGDHRVARVFDTEIEGLKLHQAVLGIERLPSTERCFDVGGKVVGMYGTDAALLHARGLLDDQGDREEQFDLLEAKALFRFGVAKGLTVSVGKCTTPLGYEVIEAPNNSLPSRSFLFGFAIPFTHTGAIATLEASDQVKLTYGLVEGWDVWEDNNDAWSQIAGVAWTSASKKDSVTLNSIFGPERDDNESDVRAVFDATWSHTWNDCVTTVLNADYGFEQGAAPGGDDAVWWGVAGYLTRKVSDRASLTARAEYFSDEDGVRLGSDARLGEVTVGLDWTPFRCVPNFHFRPELRWDHSFDGPFFDDGRERDQVSLSLDLLFTF